MNSLEELVRDALSERAHDVDGLDLAGVDPRRPVHPRRRWIAIGTVVAVAAAVLVAVVLVAPWRGSPQRNAVPADRTTPPAGTQWVSFHGITLTVPDTWRTGTSPCASSDVNAVLVFEPPAVSCRGSGSSTGPTFVVLGTAVGNSTGTQLTLDGHPASLTEMTRTSDRTLRAAHLQLPDVGVSVDIYAAAGRADDITEVLDGIAYTPVDHLGCTARLPMLTDDMGGPGRIDLDGVTSAVVCDYPDTDGAVPYLLGSRLLTAPELDRLRAIFTSAMPGAAETTTLTAPAAGLPVYLLRRANGRPITVYVDAARSPTTVSDGGSAKSTITADDVAELPRAYPS